MENRTVKTLANEIYDALLDMDFLDYDDDEAKESDLENLINDLELLDRIGSGALLYAIQVLSEDR